MVSQLPFQTKCAKIEGMNSINSKRFVNFVWITLAYTILVILWGAFVRATGSGAGCGNHWPTCNGEVLPRPEQIETFIELSHRLTSALAGLFVLVMLIWAVRLYPRKHLVRRGAIVSFVFILIEGAIGALLVRLELVAENDSVLRAVMIAIHLVNTFFLLAAIALTGWWARTNQRLQLRGHGRIGWLIFIGVAGFMLLGASGAITALGDTLFPAESLAAGLQEKFEPGVHFLIRLRLYHPLIGFAMAVYLVVASSLILEERPSPLMHQLTRTMRWLFFAQVGVGIINVLLLAPVWMQLLHLLMADIVWIAAIFLGATALSTEGVVAETAVSAPILQAGD